MCRKEQVFSDFRKKSGVALVLTVMIIGVTLAMAMIVAAIFLGQFRIASDVVQSVRAIAAADAGAEQALFAQRRGPALAQKTHAPPGNACSTSPYRGSFSPPAGASGASYCVYYDFDSASDPLNTGNFANFVIRSIGTVQNVNRAFEVLIAVSGGGGAPLDSDGDGFSDTLEAHVGTDPFDACPDNLLDAAWPPDLNNDRIINGFDIFLINSSLGQTVPPAPVRKDIMPEPAGDNMIDSSDFNAVSGRFSQTCL